jgi:thiol-disulfide isomerase/thioredoxin
MTEIILFLALLATGADGGEGLQILDFHSQGCGPCREMRPRIQLLVQKGYPVRSIDIEHAPELAERYQVTAVPTFIVVDARGNPLARTQGLRPAEELASLYNQARAQRRGQDPPRQEEAEESEPAPEESPARAQAVAKAPRPWETVVRIKIHNPPRFVGFGSGTIIYSDEEQAIILTCAHIFHIDGAHTQPKPRQFPRKITVDLFDGKITGLRPAQVHPIETLPGEAIDYDAVSDVGLIRIRPGRKLPASPVVPPSWSPKVGTPMITVGCSEGNDATAWSTKISKTGTAHIDGRTYAAVECLFAPKLGRSGGGLYTEDGYLVGVCDFADRQNNRGLYASPQSIYRFLDRNKLTALYAPGTSQPGPLLASRGASGAPKVRAQSPRDGEGRRITMPDPDLLGIRLPEEDEASQAARSESRRHIAWRAVPQEPAAPDLDRRPGDDGPARALTTDLRMEPSAAADAIDPPGDVEAPKPPAVAPPRLGARGTADAWRAARRPAAMAAGR